MKLPNIQYQQRKPLARIDPSMYVALGRAEAQAAESIGAAGKAVGDVVQDVYDRESVSQMQDAYLNYSEQMDAYSQEQKSYTQNEDTGEREGSWVSGPQRFDSYERELRDGLSKKLTSPLARRLFAEKVGVQNVQNKKVNNAQLGEWQKEHEVAGVYTRLNRQINNKKFDDAEATIVEAYTVGTIKESVAGKLMTEAKYERKNHNYAAAADLIVTPKDAIDYRKQVKGSSLKSADINRHIGAVDDILINNFQEKMNNVILDAENVNGSKAEGYNAGREYLDSVMRTKSDKLGGDEKFKEMVVSTSNTILNRYRQAVEKQTTEGLRVKRMNDLMAGNMNAGPKRNIVEYDDAFNVNVLNYQVDGKKGYVKDYNNQDPNQRAVKDNEFLNNDNGVMSQFIGYSAAGGHIPKTGASIIDAAILYGKSEQGIQAVKAIGAMYRNSPTVLNRGNENRDFSDIAAYVEMAGGVAGGEENALNLFRKRKAMSKELADSFVGSRKDNDEFFEENVETAIDTLYGEKDTAWYDLITNTSAAMKQGFKVRARTAMEYYLPTYEGDRGRALNAALISMKTSYSATGANGDYSLMLNSPESRVPNGKVNGGEWIPKQLEADVKKNFGEDIDMGNVYIEAVNKFDVNDPAYQVYQKTDDGMVRSLGVIKFDYALSKEYIDNQAELTKEQEASKRINDNARKREQWDLENPPETRKRTRRQGMGRGGNPYGRDPAKQSAIGKAIVGFAAGTKAMRKAAEEAKAITEPMKEKRLKEKAAGRKRKLGRRRN